MRINIIEKNAAKIEAALADVNGRAATHTFTTLDEIRAEARYAEDHVSETLGLVKSEMSGATATVVSGGKVPSSYNGVPIRTEITLERGASNWFLTSVYRTERLRADSYTITEAQEQAVIERMRRQFTVVRPVVADETA